jgi:hypothetical protein
MADTGLLADLVDHATGALLKPLSIIVDKGFRLAATLAKALPLLRRNWFPRRFSYHGMIHARIARTWI